MLTLAQSEEAMAVSDYNYATATELVVALAERQVSSVELTQAAIGRIKRYDDEINAVCVRDFDRALTAARAADEHWARAETAPLLGVPMTVKESFNVAGLPTTWGIPPFKDLRSTEDALAVARVKSAGAVVLGKTNIPLGLGDLQSYNSIYGTTNNPWDLKRTPGGSSGGSAAALAAGYGALSMGSDIAGSLRAPAHFCGIFAHKPTFGLLPGRGHTPPSTPPLPYERDLTVIGPMARSGKDLSLMFKLLAEPDDTTLGMAYRLALLPPRHVDLADYRILVIDTHPLIPTATSLRNHIDEFARRIAQAGARVTRNTPLMPDQTEAARLYMRLLTSSLSSSLPLEVYENMRAQVATLAVDDLSLSSERLRGSVMSHRDWLVADSTRAQLRQRWRQLFIEFDVVLCPVVPTTAFLHDQSPDQWRRTIEIDGGNYDYGDQLVWAGIASAPGLPSTVVPIGQSEEGLPIGVQILGPMYEDWTSLRFAELIEQKFGGFVPPLLDTI